MQENYKRALSVAALVAVMSWPASAAVDLPEGPGMAETEKICTQCHELAKSVSIRQDRDGWGATMQKMSGMGMKATNKELELVLAYLTEHYPPAEMPPLNVNKARAIEWESRFSMKRSEAAVILRYRREHGDFKSMEDLLKVPGIDKDAILAKQDQLVF